MSGVGYCGPNVIIRGGVGEVQLGENVLKFLAYRHLGAHAGAAYGRDGSGVRRLPTSVVASEGGMQGLRPEHGLLGQTPNVDRSLILEDVPDRYLAVGSAFGRGMPRSLLVARASNDRMAFPRSTRYDEQQCPTSGANEYMTKPIDVEKLLSLVRMWMPR